MNSSRIRISGVVEAGLISAFMVGMPVLWWSPKQWIVISAVPVWLLLMALASVARRKNAQRQSIWIIFALMMSVYLCYALLAFYFRK
jgi:CHASE2 domain-containing sensor protein